MWLFFLALTGGAYAVTSKQIGNDELGTGSVDTRTLASGAVTGPKIHSAAVGPKKIKLDKLVKYLQTRVNGECPAGESVAGILADGSAHLRARSGQRRHDHRRHHQRRPHGRRHRPAMSGIGVDPSAIQSRVTGSCSAGNVIQEINEDGTVTCEQTGTGTVTSVGSGFGLTGGPITGSGSIAADPTVLQQRVSGTCGGSTAVQSVSQAGGVSCSASFDVTDNSGRVSLAPGNAQTLLNFGGMILRATCTAGGEAVVDIGSNGGAGQFIDYQTRTSSSGLIGATVANGNFATIMNTGAGAFTGESDLGQFNVITNTSTRSTARSTGGPRRRVGAPASSTRAR